MIKNFHYPPSEERFSTTALSLVLIIALSIGTISAFSEHIDLKNQSEAQQSKIKRLEQACS